jgi:hypothetical protein
MNPLNAMQSAKLDFLLQGFKLTSVSPYFGKYVGYNIAEGALDLDLKYRVDGGKFTGDNIVIVDQLTLGDKVDSPDATKLPVKMGIALLKGPDGRITLQVPVEGDVKDPQFDFARPLRVPLREQSIMPANHRMQPSRILMASVARNCDSLSLNSAFQSLADLRKKS